MRRLRLFLLVLRLIDRRMGQFSVQFDFLCLADLDGVHCILSVLSFAVLDSKSKLLCPSLLVRWARFVAVVCSAPLGRYLFGLFVPFWVAHLAPVFFLVPAVISSVN